ncbi:MAG: polysaccharide biosynthesis protein [Frondihabitans sp.]|nr:polysaccharide biosynthesis protein [Frondihabitans sp.]
MTVIDSVRRKLSPGSGGGGSHRGGRESGLKAVGSTAVTKVLVMALSGVLGIITSRLIIHHFGTGAYVQYGLLSSFPSLLPFADLGIAAVVINAIAGSDKPRTDEHVRRTLVTALRILMVSGGIMVAIAVVITSLDLWPFLLGNGLMQGGNLVAGLCLLVYGVVLPLVVGQRILIGLKKTNVQVASQAVVAPVMLLVIGMFVLFSVPAGSFLAVVSFVANALLSVICLVIAARAISPQFGESLKLVFKRREYPSIKVVHVAWPMLVQTVAVTLVLQTDRLLLSHVSDTHVLAQYNLSAQLFGLVIQTIQAAGVTFWPIYARARAQGQIHSPMRPTLWFGGGAMLVGILLAAISPFLVEFIAGGKIHLSLTLLVSYIVFVGLQGAKYPVGMYMTDERGLKFQVVPILIMIPLNFVVSLLLIAPFGAAGPIMGSAISVAVCQVIPDVWYVRRDLAARRRAAALGSLR